MAKYTQIERFFQMTAILLAAASAGAQVMQAPGTLPNGRQVPFPPQFSNHRQSPPGAIQPRPAPPQQAQPQQNQPQPAQPAATPVPQTAAQTNLPPSLLDKPPQPAKVTLQAGDLAVQADNSSLTQILHDLSSSTGMSVDGLSQDQRVFGSYGPASPRDVLSALLQDSGYNVMMVGATADGAPRQLLLTPRNEPALSSQPSRPSQSQADDVEDEPIAPADPNTPPPDAVPSPHPPNTNQPSTPGAVHTPQEMLQELQQMRQQQQQQQQQPQ
jgi:hypothetical protein